MVEALLRKSAQEVEIDHLLAEELACDPAFVGRFLEACGLPCDGLTVTGTTAEPSFGGDGFGDLLVEGATPEGLKVALLVEDKITAGPAVRQAERYAAFANLLRGLGFDRVWTILVAPASYRGERDRYDAFVSLETLAKLIASPDPARTTYRRAVIERALEKKASTGVQVPDPALHRLKAAYLDFAAVWCAREGLALAFPALRQSYYDGDGWVEGITHPALPSEVKLRHRFWTTSKEACGLVDLIVVPASQEDRRVIADHALEGARVAPYSKGKGLQVSLPVPELRQRAGFDERIAAQALAAMRKLVAWHRTNLLKAATETSVDPVSPVVR